MISGRSLGNRLVAVALELRRTNLQRTWGAKLPKVQYIYIA